MEFELDSIRESYEEYYKKLIKKGFKGRMEMRMGLNGKEIPFCYITIRSIKDLLKITAMLGGYTIIETYSDDIPVLRIYDGPEN